MSIPLEQAVDMIVKNGGEFLDKNQNVKVDKHDFFLRPIASKQRLESGETCYFRHQHLGQDDRVFYSINVKGKNSYEAKITRIEYNGLFSNALVQLGAKLAGFGTALLKVGGEELQKWHDGDWEKAALKIVDAIGKRMAADA